ncbi:26S proteasome regulatory subunit 7 [Camellia lanceoleosa]|uniref:26S proteasome regulatory subunit 7 n=1 Tax=Camellia lanceoleosa TaxID=1840588 RepID=A0ACC0IFA9_9ERIC|nr:26S proteasome regulatory subunit 7 [Camellia lanceoleosa]
MVEREAMLDGQEADMFHVPGGYTTFLQSHTMPSITPDMAQVLGDVVAAATLIPTKAPVPRVNLLRNMLGRVPVWFVNYFRWHIPKKLDKMFFDELDAIGGARFDDGVGGDNEVQCTMLEIVNQLDGFDL